MKIVYYEEDDTLFIEFSKDPIVRDETLSWNVNIGYTAAGTSEIGSAARSGRSRC